MISKKAKKIFSVVIVIAMVALIAGAVLPYLIYTR
jgi:hypothetical protein